MSGRYRLGVDIGGTFTDATLVDEAGGAVRISSEPGEGTTVKVYLPWVEPVADEARSILDGHIVLSRDLVLEAGEAIESRLVVGADGRDSWVRNQAGISAAPLDYLVEERAGGGVLDSLRARTRR